MSFPVSLRVQLEGDTEVVNKIRSINQELEGMGKSVTKATKPMDGMSKSIDDVSSSTRAAGKNIKGYNKEQDSITKTSSKATVQVRSMGDKVLEAGQGMALAGASALSLWNAYDNVSDSAKRVEIAEGRVAGAEKTVSEAREKLNKLQQSGTATSTDLQQAQLGLVSAEGRLERAHLTLSNSQEALNEAWLNAAVTIVPSLFTGMTGLTQVYQTLKPNADELALSWANQAAAADDSGIAISELGDGIFEITETTTEAASGATEAAAGFTELGGAAAESTADMAELGGTVTEMGADFGEVAGDAAEMGGAITEVGSTAVEAGANVGELANDVAEAGGSFVELGGDVAEFSGDTLEATGNTIELAGAMEESGSTSLELGNDLGTMASAFIDVERGGAAAIRTLDNMKKAGSGLAGVLTILGRGVAFFVGAIAGLRLHEENFAGVNEFNDALGKSIDKIIPGFYDWVRGVDAMDEGASEWIATLGGLIPLTEELSQAEIDAAEAQAVQDQAVQQYNSSLSGMSPILQEVAKAWQLFDNAQAATGQRGQNLLAYFQQLDSDLKTAKVGVIDLATANGMDLNQALSMTEEEMANYILNISELGPTAEQQAEITARAAEQFVQHWTESFERIKQVQSDFASTMQGAFSTMGQELGESMEVGLSDIEKKISKGFQAFSQQFFDEIFPEDFLATAIIEGNSPDDIRDELEDLMHDVTEKEIVTEGEAKQMIQPLIDYFEKNLSGDIEKPIGYIAAQLPTMLERFKPAFLNGIVPVGAAAKESIRQNIVLPMLQGLGELETGASGLDFGRKFLDQITASLGTIRAEAGDDVADFISGILADPHLNIDQKVQSIISTLGQISEAWETDIMKMNKDADAFPDIVDDKILGPVDTMKLGILEAFQAIFEAMGKESWADALQAEINEITGMAEGMSTDLSDLGANIGSFGAPATEALQMIKERGFEVIKQSADGTLVQIKSLSEDGKQYLVDLRTGAATDGNGVEVALADIGTAAGTTNTDVKTAIDGITGSFGAMRSKLAEKIPTEAGTFGSVIYGRAPEGTTPPTITEDATALTVPKPNTSLFTQGMDALIPWAKQWVTNMETAFANFTFSGVVSQIATLIVKIQAQFNGVSNWIAGWRDHLEGFLGQFTWANFTKNLSALGVYIQNSFNGASKFIAGWRDHVQNFLGQISFSGLKSAFDKIYSFIAPGLTEASKQIGTWMKSTQEAFSNFLSGLYADGDIQRRQNERQQPRPEGTPPPGAGAHQQTGFHFAQYRPAPPTFTWGPETGTPMIAQPEPARPEWMEELWSKIKDYINNYLAKGGGITQGPYQFTSTTDGKGGGMPNPITLIRQSIEKEIPVIANKLAGLVILWQGHATAIGAQVNAVGLHFQRLIQGYNLLTQGTATALAGIMVLWQGHASGMGEMINQTGLHFQRLIQGYAMLSQGVGTALAGIMVTWMGHVSGIGAMVDGVGNHIGRLARDGYNGLVRVVGQALGGIIVTWSGHVSGVGSQVDGVGNHIGRLARDGYQALARIAQQSLSNATRAWNAHAGAVRGAATSGASSARSLAGAVASNMSRIVSSMGNATAAANRLRSAINSLQNKTITVTTRYRTVGRPGGGTSRAAGGFEGVVTQPTRLFVGEGNRPEMVSVTPLSSNASGAVKMNAAASAATKLRSSNMFQQPTIRAGGGISNSKRTDSVVFLPDGTMMQFTQSGDVRKSDWKSAYSFDDKDDWYAAARKRARKIKGLRSSETTQKLSKRDKPTEEYLAKGLERKLDALQRVAAAGGIVGRGGKSLFDLGVATKGKRLRWVIEEKRYEDGSWFRRFSDATIEFGQDKFDLEEDKEDLYTSDKKRRKRDSKARISPGPRTPIKKKKGRYGGRWMAMQPTLFAAGEGGRSEMVSIQPMSDDIAARGGGRPIVIEMHIQSTLNGKVLSETIRKELLGGIYSMT